MDSKTASNNLSFETKLAFLALFVQKWKKIKDKRFEPENLVLCPKSSYFRDGVHVCFTFPMQDLVIDHWNFNTQNLRHSITIDRGPNISSTVRLAMAKVLFVSKDFEDPVNPSLGGSSTKWHSGIEKVIQWILDLSKFLD